MGYAFYECGNHSEDPYPRNDRDCCASSFARLSRRIHARGAFRCNHVPSHRPGGEGYADYRPRNRADSRGFGHAIGRAGLPMECLRAGRSGAAAADRYAGSRAGRYGDFAGFHLCGAGANQRTALADADDRRCESAAHAPCAHGQHLSGDYVPGHAGGLQPGGPAEPEGSGTGAQGDPHSRHHRGGHRYYRRDESRL